MKKLQFIGVEINLYCLSYEYPYQLRKINCPLKGIDSYSFQVKVDWIDD